MTEANTKIRFWRLPPSLKFVVIWIGLLGLLSLLNFIARAFTAFRINIYELMNTFICFTLIIGLINKQNSARIWISILTGISLLVFVIFLGWMIFFAPADVSFWFKIFDNKIPVAQAQMLGVVIMFIFFDVIILYILLHPGTKVLFSSQPIPQESA
ncbi:MAG TPA: hypothetical protein VN843_18565 [Anaerolineales bacterium]|nr:hypothetical protein [Anaerolineales bacterium]